MFILGVSDGSEAGSASPGCNECLHDRKLKVKVKKFEVTLGLRDR
jgi:hypothetical protein